MNANRTGPAAPALPSRDDIVEGEVVLPTDTHHPMRIGLWGLALGLGGFLLWAVLAPLDEGVPTMGTVTIDTKRKAVQHLQGGIVKEVLVREGQMVKVNDPLIRLDDSYSKASYESIRQHYSTIRATEGRLLAEQKGAQTIRFSDDLIQAAGTDPLIKSHLDIQNQLLKSRKSALEAELSALQESIQGHQGQIQGYQGMLENRKTQLSLLREELDSIRSLVKEGYVPRNRQLELERSAAEVAGVMASLQGSLLSEQKAISELKLRSVQRKQEYRKEVDTQLAEIEREVQADAEKLKAATDELSRIQIRSPADGQVVGLTVQTVGAVIQPGQKLMDIVPSDETLILETRVQPNMIDRVQPGLTAAVRFSSFSHSPTLVVDGRLDSVSGDLLTDPQTGITYYLARVSITPEGMQKLGARQMQAGMPAEVVFKTGERTVLQYLLHPLTKRLAAAMKEE
ncbi:HlyD family type I secretion periplasmic adaptor subunit [Candidatus Woesearchaeota archaeon]|nr:HlyD family type I secretion periplasmic adaptor subunit [Candidatus Woesearchaeota archaeon]